MVLRDLPGRLGLLIPREGCGRRLVRRRRLLLAADFPFSSPPSSIWRCGDSIPQLRGGSTVQVPGPGRAGEHGGCLRALLFRRRWVWLCYGIAWAYSVGWSLAIPYYQPFTALLIALYAVARHRDLRQAVVALLGLIPVIAIATYNTAVLSPRGEVGVVVPVLVWCVLYGMIWTIARFAWAGGQDRGAARGQAGGRG